MVSRERNGYRHAALWAGVPTRACRPLREDANKYDELCDLTPNVIEPSSYWSAMRLARHVLIALAAGVGTYFALVLAALFVAGAVSCTKNCSAAAEFLNDAYPWPMLLGIGVALAVAAWTLRRLRRSCHVLRERQRSRER